MKLTFTQEEMNRICAFLETNEDCERLPGNEFVADLYDESPCLTLNLSLEKNELHLLAAAELLYDEELDAYYMGDAVEDTARVSEALLRAAKA